MAKKIIIDVEAKTSDAEASLGDVVKELKKLNKQSQQATQQLDEGLKDVKNSADGASKGFFKFSNILKGGLIITALNKAFEFFKETLGQNQVVVDFFATTFETLSIAFNDFFNFLFDNVGGVVDTFKSIFDDPIQSIKDFGKAIVDNVVERFMSALDAIGFLGQAVVKVFKGDFAGAAEDAKNAGKELFDVVTGVDDSFDKTVETVTKVAEATKNYVTETVNAAKANVELNKSAEKATVINQGLIEQFDIQAEKQRQIRDEERNTIEQRIEANNKLREVLEEQGNTMKANAEQVLAAAQAQFDKNASDENFIALQEAKNELLAVEATVTGFLSEQKVNDLALERERQELSQSNIDAQAERSKVERDFNAEQIENEVLRLQTLQDNLEIERQIEEERLQNRKKLFKEGTQAFADANNELLAFQKENANEQIKIEKDLGKAKVQQTSAALGALATIVGKNSKFGKAIAVVQAIRDTFAAANTALKSAPPPFNFIQAAAVVAAGIANVKSITATKEPSPPSGLGVGSSGGGVSVPTPQAPSFNVVGASAENQLAQTLADATQKPIKAFVVAGDVSTAQSLDRNIIQESSLG
jgi:hypothetical protein